MSTPSIGGGGTRSVQVVLGANAAPAVQGLNRFSAAATQAGKAAERAALQAKAAQDKQAKAAADAAKVTQTAAAKAAKAQLDAVKAAQAHAAAVAKGAEKEAAAAKAAANAAKLAAREQAAAAQLVRAEQARAAAAATAAAKQQVAAAREAAAQQKAAAAQARLVQQQLLAGVRAVAAAQKQAAAEQAAMDRLHGQAIAENARRAIAAQHAQQAAARQAAAEQAAYDRAHGAAITENARLTQAAARAQAAAAAQVAAAQAAMDRQHAAAIAENARRTQAAARAQAAAQRALAAQQVAALRQQQAMARLQAAAIAENARRTAAAAAAQLAAQRRLGQQMANDLKRQRDLDRTHQDALDENARRDADRQRKSAEAQKKVGGGLLVGGAVAAAGVLVSVAAAAKLEQAISRVGAATSATTSELVELRAAAIEAGERTQYSSVEAADGIEQLAKAGVSTADILGGALDSALDLAASGGIAVGDAAEYMASAMAQFNLKGTQATRVADLLSAVAGEAQGEVGDAALALEYVGTSAAQSGLSIEDTAGALALLAHNGITAEKAGTGLRGVLAALQSPSKKAAEEMDSLGLNLYDAQGNFVGFRGAAEQLQRSLAPLTAEQRNYSLGVIFGNAQLNTANILLKSGAKDVDNWTQKVTHSATAAQRAAERTDNLVGDIERLGGALNSALVGTGDGGLAPLRGLTKGLTGLVDSYNDASDTGKAAVLVIASVGAAAALAGGGFLILAPRIIATRAALATLIPVGSRARTVIKGLGAAAAGIGSLALIGTVLGQIEIATRKAAPGIEATTEALLKLNDASDTASVDTIFKSNLLDGFDDAFKRLKDKSTLDSISEVTSRVITLGQTGERGANQARDAFKVMDDSLARLVQGGNAEQAQQKFFLLADRVKAMGYSVDDLRSLLPGYGEALKGVDNQSKLAATGQDTLGASTGDFAEQADDARSAAERLKDELDRLNGNAISVKEAQIGFATAIRDGKKALQDAAKASKDHTVSLNANSKAGGENLQTIFDQIKAAEDYASAVADQAAATTDADTAANRGRKAYADRIQDLRKTWKEAGLTNAQIDGLIKKYAQVPDKIDTTVTAPGALEAARRLDAVRTKGLSIPDKFKTGLFLNDQATPFLPGIKQRLDAITKPRTIDIRTYFRPAPIPSGIAAPGRAEGGPIPGPFIGAKADNVLIAATPREYMQPVATHEYYGTAAMDAIRRRAVPKALLRGYADGGPIAGYAAGGPIAAANKQAAVALGPNASAAEIAKAARELERLAQAWRDANDAADKAAERAKLVGEEAKTARALAKASAKDRGDAKKAHQDAAQALRDYDKEARRSRQDAALADKETRANNRAEYEFGKLTQDQQLKSVQDRLKGERKYSDEWVALAKQRDDILAAQAETRRQNDANRQQYDFDHLATDQDRFADVDRRLAGEKRYSDTWIDLARQRETLQQNIAAQADDQDRQRQERVDQAADRLNQLLDQRASIQADLIAAQTTYDQAVQAANQSLAEQTASIIASRKEALATFDLTKKASAGSSVSIATLLKNASSQVETFTGFMEQLDMARARGVSQQVIDALGLDQGPEALAQLRKINAATGDQITQLNELVAQRTALAGTEAQREADRGLGQVGADIATATADRDAAVKQANGDLLSSQQELNGQLAALGADTGRSYADAIAAGLATGIPGVTAAAGALQGALSTPLAARITVTAVPGLATGGTVPGPFIGPRADNVIIRATPGEHVTPVAQAKKYKPLLDAIRGDRIPGFADGGYVPSSRVGGGYYTGTSAAAMDTLTLEREVRALRRDLNSQTDVIRENRRERSIVGSMSAAF